MKRIITILLALCLVLCMTAVCPLSAGAASYNIDFETASKSIYLENLDTGTVVYQKDASARRFPASTTKIMTYIITAENVTDIDNTYVTVKSEILHLLDGTGSSMAGLEKDEKLPSVRELATMLTINPNTISRAYRELEHEGYIYTSQGRGCFVSGVPDQNEKRIGELKNELRKTIEELKFLGVRKEDVDDYWK